MPNFHTSVEVTAGLVVLLLFGIILVGLAAAGLTLAGLAWYRRRQLRRGRPVGSLTGWPL